MENLKRAIYEIEVEHLGKTVKWIRTFAASFILGALMWGFNVGPETYLISTGVAGFLFSFLYYLLIRQEINKAAIKYKYKNGKNRKTK